MSVQNSGVLWQKFRKHKVGPESGARLDTLPRSTPRSVFRKLKRDIVRE